MRIVYGWLRIDDEKVPREKNEGKSTPLGELQKEGSSGDGKKRTEREVRTVRKRQKYRRGQEGNRKQINEKRKKRCKKCKGQFHKKRKAHTKGRSRNLARIPIVTGRSESPNKKQIPSFSCCFGTEKPKKRVSGQEKKREDASR